MAHIFLSLAIVCLLFQLSAATGIRLQLTHVDAKLNLTKTELSRRAVERTRLRVASLSSSLAASTTASTGNVQAPLHWAQVSYQIDIAVGTPSIPLTVIADTGSDLVWMQCAPCQYCFRQPNDIYDPSKSNTFSKLECSSSLCQSLPSGNRNCDGTDCEYFYSYADKSYTTGLLASETFTFGSVLVPGVGFGCGRMNSLSNSDGSAGIVGLARGPLSLVSQLGAGKFSYCLTSFGESSSSPLLIGSLASLSGAAAQSTPLVQNPNPNMKSFYYLSLQGISVGTTLLPIPSSVFALNSDGSGGTIIDSGTTYTGLQHEAYEAVKQEFQSQVDLPVADGSRTGFDLCFSYPSGAPPGSIPKLVFHFDGADMEFPPRNYMIRYVDAGLLCLAMLETGGTSILGGFQQQNMHVLYDLSGNALSFAAAQCDQL
ncbi:aspartic proteinase nepenthesin-1-like [Iris pallida]|uniref:Aspartic proteinase nepenthesin-1-like n=1 Tax=Iris pallida TaxID=29817 RepID=A0AAX6GM60_IRIPA|nr:aspartic proteinase nepenthesin-1-like [Iris pallida]